MSQPPTDGPPRSFFDALGHFVVARRLRVLGCMGALTLALAYAAAVGTRIDSSSEALYASDSEIALALDVMRERFGRDDLFIVLCEGDVFSQPFLERLQSLHTEVAAINLPSDESEPTAVAEQVPDVGFDDDEGWGDEAGGSSVDEITSLISVRQTRFVDGALDVGGLMDTWPDEAQLPAFRTRVLSDPNLAGFVVDPAGSLATIAIRTEPMDEVRSTAFYERLAAITAKHAAAGFRLHIAGTPAMNSTMNAIMQADANLMFTVCLLLMMFFLTVIFRHPLAVIAPLCVVVGSVIWMVGAMALAGEPITLVTNVLPAFLICVGIGDSIHILSVYRQLRHSGQDAKRAVASSIGATGLPVLLTSVTTAVGLLSFSAASLHAIRGMGLFGAIGVGSAFLHSVLTLPAMLSFHRRGTFGLTRQARGDWLGRLTMASLDLSSARGGRRRAQIVTAVAAALVLLACLGMTRLSTANDPLTYFPQDHPTRIAFDVFDRKMQGATSIAVLLEERPGHPLTSRETLLALERFQAHVAAYEAEPKVVGRQVSLLDPVYETWRALHENDPAFFRVPATERGVSDVLTLFESAAPRDLARVLTVDRAAGLLTIRVRYMESGAYEPLTRHIRAGIAEHLDGVVSARLTGTAYNEYVVGNAMQSDLLKSLSLAIGAIVVCLLLVLRSPKITAVAMAPNLAPIALLLGFMGVAGIGLDVSNLLLGSIILGISVDDTIHFLHQFRIHWQRGADREAALAQAMGHAGRAMIGTSVVLAGGFLVFLLADLNNVRFFGGLIAATVVIALLFDLIVLPALLRLTFPTSGARPDDAP